MNNKTLSFSEFENLVNHLNPWEFERLVYEIFNSQPEISSITLEDNFRDRQVDLIATETQKGLNNTSTKWIIEVKKYRSLVGIGIVEQFYAMSLDLSIPNSKLLLIVTSGLTKSAQRIAEKHNITVWGLQELAERVNPKTNLEIFSTNFSKVDIKDNKLESKEDNFVASLKKINSGNEGNDWSLYQQLVYQILEHLFSPALDLPHYELADNDKRNRRDIIFENDSTEGFWRTIREVYQGDYIVIDAKNYSKPLAKRPIIDIAHYLKPYGCGMFGIIVSRKGSGPASNHAIKEQWVGNKKMILVLSDEDLIDMLETKKKSGNPESIIKKKIADFRMGL